MKVRHSLLLIVLPLLPCGCEKEKKSAETPAPASAPTRGKSETKKESAKRKSDSWVPSRDLLKLTSSPKPGDGPLFIKWIQEHEKINDADWHQLVMAGSRLRRKESLELLASLYLRDPMSARGRELRNIAINFGEQKGQMTFIRRITLAAEPAVVAEFLYSDIGLITLIGSDRVRAGEPNDFMEKLMASPATQADPRLKARLTGAFAALNVQGKPNLETKVPPGFDENQETAKAYMEGYHITLFKRPEIMRHLSSRDILDSPIPESILSEHMVVISRLDLNALGPQRALEQFSPGESDLKNTFLRCVYHEWLEDDSKAAVDYLAAKGKDDPATALHAAYLITYLRNKGEEEKARQWEALMGK